MSDSPPFLGMTLIPTPWDPSVRAVAYDAANGGLSVVLVSVIAWPGKTYEFGPRKVESLDAILQSRESIMPALNGDGQRVPELHFSSIEALTGAGLASGYAGGRGAFTPGSAVLSF